jgi:hypothetical protein
VAPRASRYGLPQSSAACDWRAARRVFDSLGGTRVSTYLAPTTLRQRSHNKTLPRRFVCSRDTQGARPQHRGGLGGRRRPTPLPACGTGLSVLGATIRRMTQHIDEDLRGAEFRECDLTGARLIGVVMQDAVVDGLVTNLVVNGVEVTEYVEAELDRRHPVRVLIRSGDPADLRTASRQLRAGWATTLERIRRTPGLERRSVNGEWSAVQTMRHLVFVHDSWFRRCCLGSTELFTPMGIGPTVEPYRGAHGVDLSLDPTLDEIVSVRDAQAAELEAWLDEVDAAQLAAPAPVPDDDVWPPYARGRSVRQCLGTVLNETFEHNRFCVRDLDLIEAQDAA